MFFLDFLWKLHIGLDYAESAYGCLFDYLFKPSALLRQNFGEDITAMGECFLA